MFEETITCFDNILGSSEFLVFGRDWLRFGEES
jgi:hypothetical protein